MTPPTQVWLSFADDSGHLGCAIVDVEPFEIWLGALAAMARRAEIRDSALVQTNDYKTFAETFEGLAFTGVVSARPVDVDDATIVAAVWKAHGLGCNPGGEVAALPVPADIAEQNRQRGLVGRLMQRAELVELGLADS